MQMMQNPAMMQQAMSGGIGGMPGLYMPGGTGGTTGTTGSIATGISS